MASRRVMIDGQSVGDPRQTRAWRKLVEQVVREEPLCWLGFEGCTGASQTGDHVITVSARPDLAMVRSNVRGACTPCNEKRHNLPVSALNLDGPSPALSIFD